MVGLPCAQDVADALAITLERQDGSGAPWCPPRDGEVLRRWVSDRNEAFGGGIRRVVRLARLMAIADGRDYVQLLYVRLPVLRARLFERALQAAVADGRLPTSIASLTATGVILTEPLLARPGGVQDRFEIDYAQMPRVAALLDFLHNALGFAAVADLLAPVLKRHTPANIVSDVARTLHATINAWLSERLESSTHIRQAQRIRAFLANRGHVVPEAIDDEAIFLFWVMIAAVAEDERVDGYRLYRSAACSMLRYRQALRDAATERRLQNSLGRGRGTEDDEFMIDRGTLAEPGFEPWRSPLRALVSPPVNRVKWLTRKEERRLLNLLGGPADEEDQEEQGDEGNAGAWEGGLAGDERLDLAFWLTLLRADIFGTAQASIVARLRKRVAAQEAIAHAMAQIDDGAYRACAAAYGDLRAQLRLECLAALATLMEAGAAEAVILLDHLEGKQAVAAVMGSAAAGIVASGERDEITDAALGKIALALQAAMAAPNSIPEGRERLLEARAAARKVNRVGFRREDHGNADMLAALRCGAAAVVEVGQELDRLTAALAQRVLHADIAGDRGRFLAAFQTIYLMKAEP